MDRNNDGVSQQENRYLPVLFVGTVFLGAMLGFQIQPLISRAILPWFGGSPSVWTVCLLFFQACLFAGYYYAFKLIRLVGRRGQLLLQGSLLAAALFMPVLPAPDWKPRSEENPEWHILWLLACHVGLAYLAISATSPLLQVWFLKRFPGKSPYWLYACSNAGSFLGLVSVPFIFDVWFSVTEQAILWYSCFAVLCGLIASCGLLSLVAVPHSQDCDKRTGDVPRPSNARRSASGTRNQESLPTPVRRFWFLLSMVPVVMLAAITSKLTMDISPVPFLWIVPLTIYLGSLVICFSWERWADRRFWLPVSGLFMLASGVLLSQQERIAWLSSLPLQFLVHLGTLVSVCMVCHGELIRLKPDVSDGNDLNDRKLTDFYQVMALGGAAGGLLTAVVAPLVFPFYLEHHLGLLASAVLPRLTMPNNDRSVPSTAKWSIGFWKSWGVVLILGALLLFDITWTWRNSYLISRSFFGVSRVVERRAPGSNVAGAFELYHGTTRHGLQFVNPELAKLPTTYYGPTSGVGLAMQRHHSERTKRVGIVGLGVGTLAAYGRAGDIYDFYEIDPVVRNLGQNFFRYLSDCPATVNVIPGDARLAMENQQESRRYDILVLDAFSSDAVPVHLLTAEAFEIYRRHLADDGIVAVHISSLNFDLRPVLRGHANRLKWDSKCVFDPIFNRVQMTAPTFWVLMSPSPESLEQLVNSETLLAPMDKAIDWTDDKHSLFRILGHPTP